MNWDQFNDPLFNLCLSDTVVEFLSHVMGLNTFFSNYVQNAIIRIYGCRHLYLL